MKLYDNMMRIKRIFEDINYLLIGKYQYLMLRRSRHKMSLLISILESRISIQMIFGKDEHNNLAAGRSLSVMISY